ncbi:hypothetical protein [Deinococcus soli (ex Cha et al. 2016)]|uniref:DUF2637 domain-containing protein n=2 Tax=Deinococcus soli (ex Cha et al. 2016) TaxID=1309411 RepID=A0AAE3XCT4_9DEIO|nr:hypothetical protein [Deinococcus soli (ex Cha et al. 2016)]MDR6218528.1 hypothetical protein [Deinococcus soli (ex Cha et al. 2016)]MDR6329268.1 hypothetical protein [Deinococcus soli (ex Cha et al. 2016)]MDR6751541.1 hypothetical protein [Deinococcus soli (ex Cha et al. 2016)]
MKNRFFIQTLLGLLIFAYLFSLIISTAHLSQVYRLYDGSLSPYVSLGLAVALELTAFLLSLISTSLRGQVSLWAPVGSTFALGLVWFGNFYAMRLTAPDQPILITGLFSCFVPLSTMLVGKVLGDLFSLRERLFGQDATGTTLPVATPAPVITQDATGTTLPVAAPAPVITQDRPVTAPTAPPATLPAPVSPRPIQEPASATLAPATPRATSGAGVDRSAPLDEQVLQVLRSTDQPLDADAIALTLITNQEDVKASLARHYRRKQVRIHPSGGYLIS